MNENPHDPASEAWLNYNIAETQKRQADKAARVEAAKDEMLRDPDESKHAAVLADPDFEKYGQLEGALDEHIRQFHPVSLIEPLGKHRGSGMSTWKAKLYVELHEAGALEAKLKAAEVNDHIIAAIMQFFNEGKHRQYVER